MNRLRKIRRNKDKAQKDINNIRSSALKVAIVLFNFMFATFAWFLYQNNLRTVGDVIVSAWRVDFKENENILGTTLQFDVENFYPGMEDIVKQIEIINLGEKAANITYEISKLNILGVDYEIKDTPEIGDSENTLYREVTTSEDSIDTVKLLNNTSKFPFEIIITHSKLLTSRKEAGDTDSNIGSFEIRVTWPYESDGDEEEQDLKNALDSKWGYDIANFYNENKDAKSIEMAIKAIAKQVIK